MSPLDIETAASLVDKASTLAATGDRGGAIALLRDRARTWPSVAIKLCYLLLEDQRPAEALACIEPRARQADADIGVLTAFGVALKALGRYDEAVAVCEANIRAAPASAVAEHNLASTLGEAQRFEESERATSRAFQKGLDAPETWLVRGRAFQGLGRFDDAERAFRQAIRRRPNFALAHKDLAQLVWMRTENLGAASLALDEALAAFPADAALARVKSRLLVNAGEEDRAGETLEGAIQRGGDDPTLLVEAATILSWSDPPAALAKAEEAARLAPDEIEVMTALCVCNLAAGRPAAARDLAEALRLRRPLDQFPVALLAVAWRMLGDPRYRALYDYDRLVVVQALDTPPGWASLGAYLADLDRSLRDLHALKAHPVGQSLRFGAQTQQSLARSTDPAIRAFFTAIDGPIRRYLEAMREGGQVLGRDATGYQVAQSWSVLLRPGGFHVGHLHPMGWISSACHISLPAAVDTGHEGWLSFGAPGLATDPPLPAEHFVKPRAGHLALFPSYMWHATVPFDGDQPRLSAAFDLLPA